MKKISLQTTLIGNICRNQASHPFLSNFSWFSWLFFPIFMVFMVIFFLRFMVFMVFWTQFKEFLVLILKLNFDVAKFLLKISYFARNFFDYFARRRRELFIILPAAGENFGKILTRNLRFHGFSGQIRIFMVFSWFSWFCSIFMVFMVE